MKLIKMETEKQFEELKKDDLIIVKWWNYNLKHVPETKKVQAYNIYENKKERKEIICQLKHNHYFNYENYLKGVSGALEVYKVESEV